MTARSLAYHRRAQLHSQQMLAKLTGVTASTIWLIEAGRTVPRLKTMRRICEAMNLDWRDVSEFVDAMAQQGVTV